MRTAGEWPESPCGVRQRPGPGDMTDGQSTGAGHLWDSTIAT